EATVTYQEASQLCASYGGTLACIVNAGEQAVVEAMVKPFQNACWLGATNEKGTWTWESGKPFSYTNWAPYEPSGTIAGGQKEAYLGMHGNGVSAGKWNDFQKNSSSVKGFVMEASLTKITVTAMPKTTVYQLGQSFSAEGMKVTAAYSDGSSQEVAANCQLSGFDGQKAGTQTITVSYGGKTAQFQVTVGNADTELYTIHFNANGGSVSPSAQTVEYGKAVGSLPIPTRAGYEFYCWYFEQNGTRYMVEETTKYNVKRDSTFYAYWVEKTIVDNKPSDWAKAEVDTATSLGLIPSDLQSKYQTEITRAEFCRLIVNMLEKVCDQDIEDILKDAELVVDPNAFTDTNDPDILAACALGIIKGIGNHKFSPNGNITREDAATMLMRTYYGPDMEEEEAVQHVDYADRSQIGSWARNGVDLASTMKDPVSGIAVMQGVGGNRFNPKGTYTREQAYLTILRLYRCSIA
ncbi:MAG: bacterial Ig-like domain-containing protein, partial [Oscillospiraceae bacterium]|nr:bacterial Ig-like domain-containing protein [Oscillospiraceae bacterium]